MKYFPAVLLATLIQVSASGTEMADTLTYDGDEAPEKGKLERPQPSETKEASIVPDVSPSFKDSISVKRDGFSLIPGLVLLADYTNFDQDDKNLRQVGEQEDVWESRAIRLILRGHIGTDYKVNYLWSLEYNDLKYLDGQLWQVADFAFSFPLTESGRTKLAIGKMKEPFSYEMVGDAANLPHQERVLNPFFQSRNIGVQLTHLSSDQHTLFRAGVFNDSRFETGTYEDGDWQAAARLSHLLLDDPAQNSYLHLAIAGRYVGASQDVLKYRSRPESNVSDNFVDTGEFSADHAWHAGVEALWNRGPFSLLAEFNQAWVQSSATGSPSFWGGYITAGWVLTGEARPYDRTVGYARRVMPKGRWGAPELVARFSHLDMDDAEAHGGEMSRLSFGINWWATRRWKLGVDIGRTWLDRDGLNGTADSVHARVQWVF